MLILNLSLSDIIVSGFVDSFSITGISFIFYLLKKKRKEESPIKNYFP